ncbi:MAG: hypothetical protein KatS3mg027_1327 [Bacteroidia bacterium]|nr:MAG: hypothetical protein KatS3mg027_1327 [Bacteroidia bacterium]
MNFNDNHQDFENGSANARVIKAGKRTYYIDIKETRTTNQSYITITEKKKIMDDLGNFRFEKHKIFLYPEDFDKFLSALQDAVAEIQAK